MITILSLSLSSSLHAAELLMIEQEGCAWCIRWHEEIGDAYSKTMEGKKAPLVSIDIHKAVDDKYKGLKLGKFTPTFVLWDQGKEIGRIRGYPGEDFFWPLLDELLQKLPDPQG